MKVYIKILTFFLLTGFSMLMGCKRNDPAVQMLPEVIPPETAVPEKKLIPTQMGTGKSKMTFSYTAGYSLSKIAYGDGTSTVLEFTDDGKPLQLLRYNGEELYAYSRYSLDNLRRLTKAQIFAVRDDSYPRIGILTFSYNADSQLSGISYYNGEGVLTNTEERSYTAGGSLIREQNSITALTADYLYDDKNGLFKNVGYSWLFAIEEQNRLFFSVQNNVSSCSFPSKPVSNQTFSYTYTAEKYPETVKSVINGVTLSDKVTYKALE